MKKLGIVLGTVLVIVSVVLGVLLTKNIQENGQLNKDLDMMSYQIEDLTAHSVARENDLIVEIADLRDKNDELVDTVGDLRALYKSMESNNEALEETLASKTLILDSFSEDMLKREAGINDPLVILDDLYQHNEVIESSPVLGGTMFFYDAQLLTNQWALAYFEDGHVVGCGIYGYTIDDAGRIEWSSIVERVY